MPVLPVGRSRSKLLSPMRARNCASSSSSDSGTIGNLQAAPSSLACLFDADGRARAIQPNRNQRHTHKAYCTVLYTQLFPLYYTTSTVQLYST